MSTKRKKSLTYLPPPPPPQPQPQRTTRRTKQQPLGGLSGVIGLEDKSLHNAEPSRGEEENLIGYEWGRNDSKRSRHHSPVGVSSSVGAGGGGGGGASGSGVGGGGGLDMGGLGWNQAGSSTLNNAMAMDGRPSSSGNKLKLPTRPYPYGLTPYRYSCHNAHLPPPPPGNPSAPNFKPFNPSYISPHDRPQHPAHPSHQVQKVQIPQTQAQPPHHQQQQQQYTPSHPPTSTIDSYQDLNSTFNFSSTLTDSEIAFGGIGEGYESFAALLAGGVHSGISSVGHGSGAGVGGGTSSAHGRGHVLGTSHSGEGDASGNGGDGGSNSLGSGNESTSGCIQKEGW